jgi:hypothetical protein
MKMKKDIKKIFLLNVIGILIISVFGANIVSSISQDAAITVESVTYGPSQPMNKGSVRLGIIGIESSNVDGLPDETYAGILTDVDITLSGANMFGVVPIPLVFLSTGFETGETIHLKMEFFWGAVDPTGNITMIGGFARNIEWEW